MNINYIKIKLIQQFPWLEKFFTYNDGFIEEELKDTDYVMGGLGLAKKILKPDGQWLDVLPSEEKQQGRRVETMACTCFSLLNVLEMLAKFKGFGDWNKSDRFTAKLSGVTQNGNAQSRVLDSVRKLHGTVNEEVWPSKIDEFNWSEFYASIPQDVVDSGFSFVNDYEVGYEAVWATPNSLKEALKYSPLYIAGYAWALSNGLYRSYGSANHAFTLVGYVDGQYWLAFDSYSPFIKRLAWDYKFAYPKIITLNKRGENYNSAEIKNLISRGYTYVMRVLGNGEIYKLEDEKLVYISPQEWNKINVQLASDKKQLIGISEETFNKLLI